MLLSTSGSNLTVNGGGIFSDTIFPMQSVTVKNTIVAGNAASATSGQDVNGAFISQGYNLIGKSEGSTGFTNGVNNDQVGSNTAPIDPKLAPLTDNGGPTKTMALLAGSPAIDQGNSFGSTTDQRGFVRPVDFSSIPNAAGGNGADIGAFEVQAAPKRRRQFQLAGE